MDEDLLKAIYEKLGGAKTGDYDDFLREFSSSDELQKLIWQKLGGESVGTFEDFRSTALGDGALKKAPQSAENITVPETPTVLTPTGAAQQPTTTKSPFTPWETGSTVEDSRRAAQQTRQNVKEGRSGEPTTTTPQGQPDILAPSPNVVQFTVEDKITNRYKPAVPTSGYGDLINVLIKPVVEGTTTALSGAASYLGDQQALYARGLEAIFGENYMSDVAKDMSDGYSGVAKFLRDVSKNAFDDIEIQDSEGNVTTFAEWRKNERTFDLSDGFGMQDLSALPAEISKFIVDAGLASVTFGASYGFQGYAMGDELLEEAKASNPNIETNSELEVALKVGMGLTMGLLDKFGLDNVIGKAGMQKAGKEAMGRVLKSLATQKKKVTPEVFRQMVTKEALKSAKNLGGAILKGSVYEGGSEVVEGVVNVELQRAFNALNTGGELFDASDLDITSDRYLYDRLNEFTLGGILGGFTGGAFRASAKYPEVVNAALSEEGDAQMEAILESMRQEMQGASPEIIDAALTEARNTFIALKEIKAALPDVVEREKEARVSDLIYQRRALDTEKAAIESELSRIDESAVDDRQALEDRLKIIDGQKSYLNDNVRSTLSDGRYTYKQKDGKFYKIHNSDGNIDEQEITEDVYNVSRVLKRRDIERQRSINRTKALQKYENERNADLAIEAEYPGDKFRYFEENGKYFKQIADEGPVPITKGYYTEITKSLQPAAAVAAPPVAPPVAPPISEPAAEDGIDNFIAQSGINAQLETSIGNLTERMNNADYIEETELNNSANELYKIWDRVDSDERLTSDQKESMKSKIENLITQLEGYELATETTISQAPTGKTAKGFRVIGRTTKGIPSQYAVTPERVAATGDVVVTESDGTRRNAKWGVNDDGTLTVTTFEGEAVPIQDGLVLGEILKDAGGNVTGAVLVDESSGAQFRIKDSDLALDMAIKAKEAALGPVSPGAFREVFDSVAGEVVVERRLTREERVSPESRQAEEAPAAAKPDTVTISLSEGKPEGTYIKVGDTWYIAKKDGTPSLIQIKNEKSVTKLNTEQNAIQERSTEKVVQRQQRQVGQEGGRQVEQGKQGQEAAKTEAQKQVTPTGRQDIPSSQRQMLESLLGETKKAKLAASTNNQAENAKIQSKIISALKAANPNVKFATEEQLLADEDARALLDSGGTIYGAVLSDGSVYINPDYNFLDTPIHEFTHIWEMMNPDAWAEGISLFEKTKAFESALEEIESNPAYANHTDTEKKSEALNTLLGRNGVNYFKSGVSFSKFKAWADKFIKNILNKLGIRNITAEDRFKFFQNAVFSDLFTPKKEYKNGLLTNMQTIYRGLYRLIPNVDFLYAPASRFDNIRMSAFQSREYEINDLYNAKVQDLFGGVPYNSLSNEDKWAISYLKSSGISPSKFDSKKSLMSHIDSELKRIEKEVMDEDKHVVKNITNDDVVALKKSYERTGDLDNAAAMSRALDYSYGANQLLSQRKDAQKDSFKAQMNHFRSENIPKGLQLILINNSLTKDYRVSSKVDVDGRKGDLDIYKRHLLSQGMSELEIEQRVSDLDAEGKIEREFKSYKRVTEGYVDKNGGRVVPTINPFFEFDMGAVLDAVNRTSEVDIQNWINNRSLTMPSSIDLKAMEKFVEKKLSNGAKLYKLPANNKESVKHIMAYSAATKKYMTEMAWCTSGEGKATSVNESDVYVIIDKKGVPLIQVTYNSDGSIEQLGGIGGNQSVRVTDSALLDEVLDLIPNIETELPKIRRDKLLSKFLNFDFNNVESLPPGVSKDDVKWLIKDAPKGDTYNNVTEYYKSFSESHKTKSFYSHVYDVDSKLITEEPYTYSGGALPYKIFLSNVSFYKSELATGAIPEGVMFNDEVYFILAELATGAIPEGVTFGKKVYFSNAKLSTGAISEGVTFGGFVDFTEATLEEGAISEGVTFNGYVKFYDAQLATGAISEGVTFGGDVDFNGAKLSTGAISEGVTFGEEVYFSNAELSTGAISEGVTFGGDVDFRNAELSTGAISEGVAFGEEVDFSNAKLSTGAISEGVTFNGDVDFDSAKLSTGAISEGVAFNGYVKFYDAQLATGAISEGLTFGEEVYFSNAKLSTGAISEGVTFGKKVYFSNAELSTGAISEGVTFGGYVSFYQAKLAAGAISEGAVFNGEVFPEGILKKSGLKAQATMPAAKPGTTQLTSEETKSIDKASTNIGVKADGIRKLYSIGRDLFGLGRLESLTQAIVIDRMIGKMAKSSVKYMDKDGGIKIAPLWRVDADGSTYINSGTAANPIPVKVDGVSTNVTKQEIYDTIEFKKATEGDIADLSNRGKALFQIVGENANLADNVRNNLVTAREMEDAGKDAKTIRIATGWERGKDGKWRYEIEDVAINKSKLLTYSNRELSKEGIPLQSVVGKDAEIFKLYPQLLDLKVKINVNLFTAGSESGTYIPRDKTIIINTDSIDSSSTDKILSHELQHAVQLEEGFARGGNISFLDLEGAQKSVIDGIKKSSVKRILSSLEETLGKPFEDNLTQLKSRISEVKKLKSELASIAAEYNSDKGEKTVNRELRVPGFMGSVAKPVARKVTARQSELIDRIYELLPESEAFYAFQSVEANSTLAQDLAIDRIQSEINFAENIAKAINSVLDAESMKGIREAMVDWAGSETAPESLSAKGLMEILGYETYRRLAGEVEARNVQERMGMTPEQRRQTLLQETEDVSRDEQIVLFQQPSQGVLYQGSPLSSVEATAKALEGVDNITLLAKLRTFSINKLKEFFHASSQKRQGRLKKSNAPQFGTGVYFSTSRDLVENEFGENVTNVVLNLSNPVFTNTKEWNEVTRKAIELADKEYGEKNGLKLEEDETYFTYDPDNLSEIDEIPSNFISDAAQELGYDAIVDENSNTYENEIVVLDDTKIIYTEDISSFISEAYHKAKKDGSNPELVKAVEDLLGEQPSQGVLYQGAPEFTGKSGADNFKRWKGNRKLLSEAEIQRAKTGVPIVVRVYHGTTNDFYEFDASIKGNIEGHLGKVNYFTSEYQDASSNYQADGADLTGRIDRRQEEIEQLLGDEYTNENGNILISNVRKDFNISTKDLKQLYPSGIPKDIKAEELSRFIAERELKGKTERVLDVFVKLNNPVVLGNGYSYVDLTDRTKFEKYLEDAAEEIAEENGITIEEAKEDYQWDIDVRAMEMADYQNPLLVALEKAIEDNTYDYERASEKASEILSDFYDSEVNLNQLESKLRDSLFDSQNEQGELSSSQIISDFFKNLGFDGIILTNVSTRFRNMGLSPSTSHVHVFDEFSNQIKLADGTNTSFGETRDIRFQRNALQAQGAMAMMQDGRAVVYAMTNPNVSTPLHELAHVFERYLNEADHNTVLKAAKTATWSTATSEYFARGFERYLAEGIAPTKQLQKIFDKFASWLADIYGSIVNSDIDVQINDAMRDIYARMLGSDNAATAMDAANRIDGRGVLTDKVQETLPSDSQLDLYDNLLSDTSEAAPSRTTQAAPIVFNARSEADRDKKAKVMNVLEAMIAANPLIDLDALFERYKDKQFFPKSVKVLQDMQKRLEKLSISERATLALTTFTPDINDSFTNKNIDVTYTDKGWADSNGNVLSADVQDAYTNAFFIQKITRDLLGYELNKLRGIVEEKAPVLLESKAITNTDTEATLTARIDAQPDTEDGKRRAVVLENLRQAMESLQELLPSIKAVALDSSDSFYEYCNSIGIDPNPNDGGLYASYPNGDKVIVINLETARPWDPYHEAMHAYLIDVAEFDGEVIDILQESLMALDLDVRNPDSPSMLNSGDLEVLKERGFNDYIIDFIRRYPDLSDTGKQSEFLAELGGLLASDTITLKQRNFFTRIIKWISRNIIDRAFGRPADVYSIETEEGARKFILMLSEGLKGEYKLKPVRRKISKNGRSLNIVLEPVNKIETTQDRSDVIVAASRAKDNHETAMEVIRDYIAENTTIENHHVIRDAVLSFYGNITPREVQNLIDPILRTKQKQVIEDKGEMMASSEHIGILLKKLEIPVEGGNEIFRSSMDEYLSKAYDEMRKSKSDTAYARIRQQLDLGGQISGPDQAMVLIMISEKIDEKEKIESRLALYRHGRNSDMGIESLHALEEQLNAVNESLVEYYNAYRDIGSVAGSILGARSRKINSLAYDPLFIIADIERRANKDRIKAGLDKVELSKAEKSKIERSVKKIANLSKQYTALENESQVASLETLIKMAEEGLNAEFLTKHRKNSLTKAIDDFKDEYRRLSTRSRALKNIVTIPVGKDNKETEFKRRSDGTWVKRISPNDFAKTAVQDKDIIALLNDKQAEINSARTMSEAINDANYRSKISDIAATYWDKNRDKSAKEVAEYVVEATNGVVAPSDVLAAMLEFSKTAEKNLKTKFNNDISFINKLKAINRSFTRQLKSFEKDLINFANNPTDDAKQALTSSIKNINVQIEELNKQGMVDEFAKTTIGDAINSLSTKLDALSISDGKIVDKAFLTGVAEDISNIEAALKTNVLDRQIADARKAITDVDSRNIAAIARILPSYDKRRANTLLAAKRAELSIARAELQKKTEDAAFELGLNQLPENAIFRKKAYRLIRTYALFLRQLKAMGDISANFSQLNLMTYAGLASFDRNMYKTMFVLQGRIIAQGARAFWRLANAGIKGDSSAVVAREYAMAIEMMDGLKEQYGHDFYLMEKAGLEFTTPGDPNSSEEFYMAGALNNIPVITGMKVASEIHMSLYMNAMRMAAFKQFLRANPNANDFEKEQAAQTINELSGRTKLVGLERKVVDVAGPFLFAPRMYLSQAKSLGRTFAYGGKLAGYGVGAGLQRIGVKGSFVRGISADADNTTTVPFSVASYLLKHQLKALAGYTSMSLIIGFLLSMFDDDEEKKKVGKDYGIVLDPYSNNFLKSYYEKYTAEGLGGYGSMTRMLTRTAFAVKGKPSKLAEDYEKSTYVDRFFSDNRDASSPFWKWLKGKTAPSIRTAVSIFSGTDYYGIPYSDNAFASRGIAFMMAHIPIPAEGLIDTYRRLKPDEKVNLQKDIIKTGSGVLGLNVNDITTLRTMRSMDVLKYIDILPPQAIPSRSNTPLSVKEDPELRMYYVDDFEEELGEFIVKKYGRLDSSDLNRRNKEYMMGIIKEKAKAIRAKLDKKYGSIAREKYGKSFIGSEKKK